MPTLCDRFKRDVEEMTCVSCDWPESDASERDTPRPRSRSPSADANASTSLRVAVSTPPKSARTSTTLSRYSTSARTPNSTASSVQRTWSYWGRSSNTSPKASVKLRDWWIETTSTYIAISPNSEISTSSSSKMAGLDERRSRFWPTALPREASPSGTRRERRHSGTLNEVLLLRFQDTPSRYVRRRTQRRLRRRLSRRCRCHREADARPPRGPRGSRRRYAIRRARWRRWCGPTG